MNRLEPWTHDEVVLRLRECGDTVRRLPRPKGPGSYGSGMPDVVRDWREAYGYSDSGRPAPAKPSSRSIDRMDECFTWFRFLEGYPKETRAMWLSACCGLSFAQTGRILGATRKTIRGRAWAGVQRIVAGLNADVKKNGVD